MIENHGNDNGHRRAAFGVHGLAENEEEDEREKIIEENDRALAEGQL
jgi:hypothetical protein